MADQSNKAFSSTDERKWFYLEKNMVHGAFSSNEAMDLCKAKYKGVEAIYWLCYAGTAEEVEKKLTELQEELIPAEYMELKSKALQCAAYNEQTAAVTAVLENMFNEKSTETTQINLKNETWNKPQETQLESAPKAANTQRYTAPFAATQPFLLALLAGFLMTALCLLICTSVLLAFPEQTLDLCKETQQLLSSFFTG